MTARDPLLGAVVAGRYEVLRLVGKGGMGSIYEVRQEGTIDEEGQRAGARIVVVTHKATDAALSETVAALADHEAVESINSVLRLEGTAE